MTIYIVIQGGMFIDAFSNKKLAERRREGLEMNGSMFVSIVEKSFT